MAFDSFWSVWFWVAHVVTWSMASHFAMGVPYDMIIEANREKSGNGPWANATEALILAQVFRFTTMARRYGTALTLISCFILSSLLTLGTLGNLEFARALSTILFPLTLVYVTSIRTAEWIDARGLRGRALRDAIRRQRLVNQLIGLLALIVTVAVAVWEVLSRMTPFMF